MGYTPPRSSHSMVATDPTLQQVTSYIGRMKTLLARSLALDYTNAGDPVVDPFPGSGVLALQSAAAGRLIVAGDWNPYTVLLHARNSSLPSYMILLVVIDATSGRSNPGRTSEVSEKTFAAKNQLMDFVLEQMYQDVIPDILRARRECRCTKRETVLVFKRVKP